MSLFKSIKLSGVSSAVKMLFAGFGLMLAALAFAFPAQAAGGKAAPAKGGEGAMLALTVNAGGHNGKVYIKLRPDLAPRNVAQVEKLVKEGKYNDVVFHRVIGGFMAQTGDVQYGNRKHYDEANVGTGGSDLGTIPAEFSNEHFVRGTVGMARTQDPNSANSQFFICYAQVSSLDGQYTVIGNVVKGMDYIDELKKGSQADNGKVEGKPDYIVKAELVTAAPKK